MTKPIKRALFLDFDGTTLPLLYEQFLKQMNVVSKGKLSGKDKFGYYFLPEIMTNINILVDQFNVDIIVTSTWKDDLKLKGIVEMWNARAYPGNVVAITKTININKRGLEIKQYLSDNFYDKYVIIDDMSENNFETEQLPFLVKCDPNFGFDHEKLKEAITKLS